MRYLLCLCLGLILSNSVMAKTPSCEEAIIKKTSMLAGEKPVIAPLSNGSSLYFIPTESSAGPNITYTALLVDQECQQQKLAVEYWDGSSIKINRSSAVGCFEISATGNDIHCTARDGHSAWDMSDYRFENNRLRLITIKQFIQVDPDDKNSQEQEKLIYQRKK